MSTYQDAINNADNLISENGTAFAGINPEYACLLYTSPSPRDLSTSRMPSSA